MLLGERKIPINKAGYKAIQERILIIGDCEKIVPIKKANVRTEIFL